MLQRRSIFRSSNSLINFEKSKFKNNVVQLLGGEDQFQFVVISFCERIKNDRSLKKCYKDLDMKKLIELQKDMILASFLDITPNEFQTLRSKLILRYHLIFQEEGFPDDHFDALEENFVGAMRDAWVDEDVLELCRGFFTVLRSILVDCSDMTAQSKQQQDAFVGRVCYCVSERLLEAYAQSEAQAILAQ